jgi:solute:Na+ symporter, SSS family
MSQWLLFAADAEKAILNLSPVDYFVIIIYFIVVLWIGFYLKKSTETSEDFFMAGRKMSAWIAGLSFISANLSSLETMGWSAMATQYGMIAAHAYFIGAIPAILFLAVVMMPFYYICKTHSVPGYLKLRYNEGSRVVAGISFTFMTVLVCGANMFAMALILKTILGWNMHLSIWVSSVTVAVYVALGGLMSAVFNEVVQFFLIWLGTLLVPILGLWECGGSKGLLGGWQGMVDKIHNSNFMSLWANTGSASDNGMGVHWAGIVFGWGLAISFGYWCTDFLQVQRVMAAKSLRAASNGTIIGAAFKMCVPLIVTLPGLLGVAILMNTLDMKLVPENQAEITGLHSYNQVLPLLMARYLGPGLLGLGVTAMIAGFMSGMAGNISAFATVWTYDVYRPLIVKNAKDSHYVAMGRWCSIIGVLIAIATAYVVMLFSNILVFFHVLIVLFVVPLFGVVIIGMLWKQATPRGGFWGLVIGTLASCAMFWFARWYPMGNAPLMEEDFHNLPQLRQQLLDPKTPLSQYIAGKLSPKTVEYLKNLNVEEIEKQEKKTWVERIVSSPEPAFVQSVGKAKMELTKDLNALIDQDDLYTPERFEGVKLSAPTLELAKKDYSKIVQSFSKLQEKKLSPETVSKIKKDLKVENVERLNRLLLDEAYPNEIAPMKNWVATKLNPDHAEILSTSRNADTMGVNQFCAFWALLITVGSVLMVSLFTKPKPDAELGDLVYGLKALPDEGRCPWYEKPAVWAAVVLIVLIAFNIIFW